MACQCLRRLRIFVCSNIKRYTGRLNGFKSATVSESVSAGKLNRIYITTSQLGCLRRCLFFGVTQRAKVQPLSLSAQVVDQAVVVPGALSVPVDLHHR